LPEYKKIRAGEPGLSQEAEGATAGAGGNGAAIDPMAIALALGSASRERADIFLEEQTRLARLQAQELSHELGLRHWSLWVRHLSGLLKLTLEIGLAVVATGLACFIAAAVWNAAHSDGLVIESFSVPPDLGQRGLTGQVVAGQLLDRLSEVNQATISSRTGKSYAASWGDDIKVEIPDTGISVAEAYRFLRRWLGHESHISGAVWHSEGNITLAARSDGQSITVSGSESDLDALIRKLAEGVFGLAEPYRYAVYLTQHGREEDGVAIFRRLAASGPAADRAWGLVGLARAQNNRGDISQREVERLYGQAILLDPSNSTAVNNHANAERGLGHLEATLAGYRQEQELLARGYDRELGDIRAPVIAEMAGNSVRGLTGAYGEAIPSIAEIIRTGRSGSFANLSGVLISAEIPAHDLKAAKAEMASQGRENLSAVGFELSKSLENAQLALAEENWSQIIAAVASAEQQLKRHPALRDWVLRQFTPLQAYARARLGQLAEAQTLIGTTPPDCDECMLWRARIAELAGQHGRAEWWLERAAAHAPSIPLIYSTWGELLLRRGDPEGAIAKFKIANQKGPRFADPLVFWGEALIAENQSDLALKKFAEANKYTPNWGRLHLKWGEALAYVGKRDEAKVQFARAIQLDLTPSEKAELSRQLPHA
jgi:tetratricopeptide (TPR) repeat protein